MTKNYISHFCQYSQNFYQLRSSFDVDNREQLDRWVCNFLDLSQHLKYANDTDGISKCEQKIANTHPNKCTHPYTYTDIRLG